jgi:predicted enzyme related to lactoylglutathione lyase
MTHFAAAHWFEILAQDMNRAVTFYEAILATSLRREDMGGMPLAIFPHEKPAVGGCLMPGAPSEAGTIVYLNVDGRLDQALAAVADAGGTILTARYEPPNGLGSIAHIRDSEGNRVGLHAA